MVSVSLLESAIKRAMQECLFTLHFVVPPFNELQSFKNADARQFVHGFPALGQRLLQEGCQLLGGAQGRHLDGRHRSGRQLAADLVMDEGQILQRRGDRAFCLACSRQLRVADDALRRASALDGVMTLALAPSRRTAITSSLSMGAWECSMQR